MLGQSVKIGKHLTGVHVGTDTSHLVMMVDDDTDIMENGYSHYSITLFQSLTSITASKKIEFYEIPSRVAIQLVTLDQN